MKLKKIVAKTLGNLLFRHSGS